jgi:DNA-binding transcriptional MerR regulator
MMQAVHRKDVDTALALVDERHADLHRERSKIDAAVEAMQTLVEHTPKPGVRQRQRGLMRVSAAAKAVGVLPSA